MTKDVKPADYEMNLSLNSSSLKIYKYHKKNAAASSKVVLTNDTMFRLFHPETECFVSASCDKEKDERSSSSDDFSGATARPDKSRRRSSFMGLSSGDVKIRRHRPYLRKVVDQTTPFGDANKSAKAVFVFERETRNFSWPVTWETPVRIRHLATDKYLYVSPTAEDDRAFIQQD